MKQVHVGAVGYLNARPLVYGLDRHPRFRVRYDVPSECARLLHEGTIDIGLIPSIEYLRGGPYRVVPDLAIASRGPVASVALFTTKAIADVRSIAMDTSSRTSVALTRVLCARLFRIQPTIESRGPDLDDMLDHCDAALIIGDNALFLDTHAPALAAASSVPPPLARSEGELRRDVADARSAKADERSVEKIDLGEAWTRMTGQPFVWAFWAGRPGALEPQDVVALQRARDEGVERPDELAREYLADAPARQPIGADYLRHNIKYYLREEERAALDAFYRYAFEAGVVPEARPIECY